MLPLKVIVKFELVRRSDSRVKWQLLHGWTRRNRCPRAVFNRIEALALLRESPQREPVLGKRPCWFRTPIPASAR
jgi:hypothetical protein